LATKTGLDDWFSRTVADVNEIGWIHQQAPLQNFYDQSLQPGIVRFDMLVERIPKEAALSSLTEMFQSLSSLSSSSTNSSLISYDVTATLSFWRQLQLTIHNRVHATIGGFMRSPASPVDPIFFPWHATIDLLGYFWELCHEKDEEEYDESYNLGGNGFNGQKCLYTQEAREVFANVSFDHMHYIESLEETTRSLSGLIDEDLLIGRYFANIPRVSELWHLQEIEEKLSRRKILHGYIYNDDAWPELQNLLKANQKICPSGLKGMVHEVDRVALKEQNQTIPTYTKNELDTKIREWIDRSEMHWKSSSPRQVDTSKAHAECILANMDHDTLERWAIDDAFVSQIVEKNLTVYNSACSHLTIIVEPKAGLENSGGFLRRPCDLVLTALLWLVMR